MEFADRQAARGALRQGAFLRALLITLRLKDAPLLREVILATPPSDVRSKPLTFYARLISHPTNYSLPALSPRPVRLRMQRLIAFKRARHVTAWSATSHAGAQQYHRQIAMADMMILRGLCMQVDLVAARVPAVALVEVLNALAEALKECPHLEFLLRWVRALCLHHGSALQVCSLSLSVLWHLAPACTVKCRTLHGRGVRHSLHCSVLVMRLRNSRLRVPG